MNKEKIIFSFTATAFIVLLFIYGLTSNPNAIYIHSILLFLGLFLSIFLINKAAKSDNTLRSKISFSFVTPLLIFFMIVFFWFMGDRSFDDWGIGTVIIVIPSACIFASISFLIGLTLSVKRKAVRDYEINLNKTTAIIGSVCLLLCSFCFTTFFYLILQQ